MMDNDVEARLREALRLHAAESPGGAAMLSAVRTIAVRRRRRRHTSWAAAAAVLIVLSAAAVPGMLRRPEPFATPPAVRSALTAGTPISVAFPYSLAGATVVIAAGRPTLRDKGFEVWTTPVAPTGTPSNPVAVRGKAGTIVGTTEPMLSWSETPGEWIVVASPGNSPKREDLLALAGTLTGVPSAGAVPFTFSLMPDGYTIDNVEASVVTFSPPGVGLSQDFMGKIAVMLDDTPAGTAAAPDTAETVVVTGDRKALLRREPGAVMLSVPLDGGRTLVVQDTMAVHLSRQDLLDFAGGIAVTAAAVAAKG